MTPGGDMTFGRGSGNFYVDSGQAVAQLIGTRLRLWAGEWFLDLTEGTPYSTKILGAHTGGIYNAAIQSRILDTPGVINIGSYSSSLDPKTRILSLLVRVNTQFSQSQVINQSLILGGGRDFSDDFFSGDFA